MVQDKEANSNTICDGWSLQIRHHNVLNSQSSINVGWVKTVYSITIICQGVTDSYLIMPSEQFFSHSMVRIS